MGYLNYVFDFFLHLSNLILPLHDRPPPWTNDHTRIIRLVKNQVKCPLCLHISNPSTYKVVETDASDIGYGDILKQVKDNNKQIVAFTSKHWNPTQKNYFTIKKEILEIILCISKF